MSQRLTERLALLLPALAVLALYWGVLRGAYVWDDYNYLLHDSGLRDARFIWRTLTQPFLESLNYFRPLVLISYALEQSVDGSPLLPHLTNLLLAMANATLVALLARRAAPVLAPDAQPWHAAALAGLLYALHPALVEPTAWISGRFDLACTFFGALLLYCDRAIARTALRVLAMFVLFLLAALCKEAALGLAVILPLWQWMLAPPELRWRERRGDLWACAAVGLAGLLYLGLRRGALGYVHMDMPSVPYVGLIGHAALVFNSIGGYALLVLWPFSNIGPQHEIALGGVRGFDGDSVLGIAVLVVLLLLAWHARRGARLHLLPLCALLALLPALNLVPIEIKQNYMHDRFLTFPLVLLSLWATLALLRLPPRLGNWALGTAAMWALMAAIVVGATIPHWHDDLSLWKWAYTRTPRSDTVIDNLQSALFDTGNYADCRGFSEFVRQQSGPLAPVRHTRYALSLAQVGEHDAAVREMDDAVAAAATTRLSLVQQQSLDTESGWLYLYEGYPQKGRERLARVLARDPGAGEANYFMAAALMVLGEEAGARRYAEAAFRLIHPSQRARREGELAGFVKIVREHTELRARGKSPQAPEQNPPLN